MSVNVSEVQDTVLTRAREGAWEAIRSGGIKPSMGCSVEIIVRDKDGNVLDTRRKDDDLFTFQFCQMFAQVVSYTELANSTTWGGTYSLVGGGIGTIIGNSAGPYWWGWLSRSIVFGTSTTAAKFSDYQVGTGWATVGATVLTGPPASTNTAQYYSTATNSGGTTINVSEVATYLNSETNLGGPGGFVFGTVASTICITHDVFAAVAVPPAGQVTAVYTWTWN